MRVTARQKEQTRQRILAAARRLFRRQGLDGTTTRQLADAAAIATGTLFNYFPTKESLAMVIVAEALDRAHEEFQRERRGDEPADEALFAHVVAGLRHLEPYRRFVGEVLDTALSPLTAPGRFEAADDLRLRHLQEVEQLVSATSIQMHLYWTLYVGVLAFWVGDESPHQQSTLALLDQSMRLFVAGLDPQENENATDAC